MFVLGLTSVVVAQDDQVGEDLTGVETMVYVDPDPVVITDMTSDATIEAITDNSTDYYGAIVTVEGEVNNMVGTRLFEISEDEFLSDSRVLVANNSSETFPAQMVEGMLVRVTGRVQPSYDIYQGDQAWTYTPFDENAEQIQIEEGQSGRLNMVSFIHSGYVPEVFGQHTILEVLNIENVEIMGYDDDLLAVE
jgi:hypothetical protein